MLRKGSISNYAFVGTNSGLAQTVKSFQLVRYFSPEASFGHTYQAWHVRETGARKFILRQEAKKIMATWRLSQLIHSHTLSPSPLQAIPATALAGWIDLS